LEDNIVESIFQRRKMSRFDTKNIVTTLNTKINPFMLLKGEWRVEKINFPCRRVPCLGHEVYCNVCVNAKCESFTQRHHDEAIVIPYRRDAFWMDIGMSSFSRMFILDSPMDMFSREGDNMDERSSRDI